MENSRLHGNGSSYTLADLRLESCLRLKLRNEAIFKVSFIKAGHIGNDDVREKLVTPLEMRI